MRHSAGSFTEAEVRFLLDGPPLGRLATIGTDGMPHNVPVGYRYDPTGGTVGVGGRDLENTQKFRNVRRNPGVCLVIDDVLPPWRPRCVVIRGTAEAVPAAADGSPAVIRLKPVRVHSWGVDE